LALLYTLKSMDFFLRFAAKIILLVNAKSILFLRMCKESTGILLRFSLELSKYEAEIYHVPGEQNQISDLLSREHESLADIIKAHKNRHILTEAQTEHILNRLCIPEGRKFSAEEVRWMLEADSIKNPMIEDTKKKPQSKAKTGVRQLQNSPITLQARKVKMPRETSFYRPGVVLPVCKTRLISDEPHHMSYTDFQTATKMITSRDISIRNVIEAQKADKKLSVILNLPELPTNFKIIENLLYHRKKDHCRLALPEAFLDPLINAKHYTAFGIHHSKARIKRVYSNTFLNPKIFQM
jgi:hypothetical protein